MSKATRLDDLIEQHRLAREHYYRCKHQERSGDTNTAASDRDALARADLAWEKAELALWRQRSPFVVPKPSGAVAAAPRTANGKRSRAPYESGPMLAKPYDYQIPERHLHRLLGR